MRTRSALLFLFAALLAAVLYAGGSRLSAQRRQLQMSPQIVFSSTVNDEDPEIYIMNEDGSGQTRLTDNEAHDGHPRLSPDLARIVFVSVRDGNPEVYLMNTDGTGQTRLTDHVQLDGDPAFSPDGAQILFTSSRDGGAEIYLMNTDGSGLTRVTSHPAWDEQPAFSPDGTRIAFVSDRASNFEIHVMNVDGSGVTRLTDHPADDRDPTWSPDGTRIAFASERDGNSEIYVVNADGSDLTRLTTNTVYDGEPVFSPDGLRIAFTCELDLPLVGDICVMNVDGSGRTPLTSNVGIDVEPDWRSPPPAAPRARPRTGRRAVPVPALPRRRFQPVALPAVTPRPCPQEAGSLRRVYSFPGQPDPIGLRSYGAVSAHLYLPSKFPPPDRRGIGINSPSIETAYIMVGGWGDTGGAIDAGFQYSFTADNWSPFMRLERRRDALWAPTERFKSDQEDVRIQFFVTANDRVRVRVIGELTSGQAANLLSPELEVFGNWRANGVENRMKRTTSIAVNPRFLLRPRGSFMLDVVWDRVGIGRSINIVHPWGEEDTDLPAGSCRLPPEWVTVLFDSWSLETVHIDTRVLGPLR